MQHMTTSMKLGTDPHVVVQGFLEKLSKRNQWRNYFFVLRYNKIKNCSSLCCYRSDKITPSDLPKHVIDFYYVTCVRSPSTYTIEITSITSSSRVMTVRCPDRPQFLEWMSSIEFVRSMSLFTCEKSDMRYSNISNETLNTLHHLYNSVMDTFLKDFLPAFKKEKQVSTYYKNKNQAMMKSAIANGVGTSRDMGNSIHLPIAPSHKHPFLERYEERCSDQWNQFREEFCDQIVFSDSEIPKNPNQNITLRSEFCLGENIYGRAYWPHALRNYALGKEVTDRRKRHKNYKLIYGPQFRTAHALFLFLFMKIDGVYQVGEGEINESFQSWSYANFGNQGSIQTDEDLKSGKVDFWALDQTIKLHIFNFEVSSNADSWEISSQNFVKLSLQLQLGRNYEVEFELRFMLKSPSTNMQIDPLFDTKLSEPISTGKFMYKVPMIDHGGSSTPRGLVPQTPRSRARNVLASDDWISRLPREETCLCEKCCTKLEEIIQQFLVNEWVAEVYHRSQLPILLCITGPRVVFKKGEFGIPTRVHVYRDPRHGWSYESVTQLQCSLVLKLSEKVRRKISMQQVSVEEKNNFSCDFCMHDETEDITLQNLHAVVINEKKELKVSKVPDSLWKKIDRCPEQFRHIL